MASYRITKKAAQDLKQIWNYTFDNWTEKQADKYYKQILNQFSTIAENPATGKGYESILNGLRGMKVKKHIIFYRQISNLEIEIERILHERMDLEARLSKN